MDKDDKEALNGCCILLSFPILILYSAFSWDIVIQLAWQWYTVPVWGVAPLTFKQALTLAVALLLIYNFLNDKKVWGNKNKVTEDLALYWDRTVGYLIHPWLVLTFLFLIKIAYM